MQNLLEYATSKYNALCKKTQDVDILSFRRKVEGRIMVGPDWIHDFHAD